MALAFYTLMYRVSEQSTLLWSVSSQRSMLWTPYASLRLGSMNLIPIVTISPTISTSRQSDTKEAVVHQSTLKMAYISPFAMTLNQNCGRKIVLK